MKAKKWVIPSVLTVIITVFILYQLEVINLLNSSTKTDAREDEEFESKEEFQNEIEEEVQKNLEFPEKDKLVLKILDSTEYFTTVEGEFEEFDRKLNTINTTEFTVDVENRRSIGTYTSNGTKKQTIIIFEDQNKEYQLDEVNRTYREFELTGDLKQAENIDTLTAAERLVSGNARTIVQYDGFAFRIINSELVLYLQRFEDWEFEEITYLDLPCYKLTGVIDETVSSSLNGPFEMIVHKETGLVLGYRSFDENNEVRKSLTLKWIKIDEGLDEDTFKKDLSAYKKLERKINK